MKNIGEKIKEYAQQFPNKTAIEYGDTKITYFQLEEESNLIANILTSKSYDKKYVFVMIDKSPALIKTMIGIIKAGMIFVPIDINHPKTRILEMLNEIPASWIITTNQLLEKVENIADIYNQEELNVLLMNDGRNEKIHINNSKSCKVLRLSDFEDLTTEPKDIYYNNKDCYVYFTSGSTGKPKAVLGRHRSLLHFIEWEISEFNIDDTCRVSQLTRPVFDPFLRDVLVPLCSGGVLCIPENDDLILNPIKLIKWINEKDISLIHLVPSLFKIISEELKDNNILHNLQYVFLAGELLRGNDIKKWIEIMGNRVQLVNLYGPTETTLAKFFYRIDENDYTKGVIPVGKPINYSSAYILNENMEKCPTGTIGEVYIRTPFISSGYVNDKELTRNKFIKNPFNDNPNDFIYKTGDLGKKLFNGDFEVIGRIDNQIKIRGMRIEAGEIENILIKHSDIKDAVVMAKEDEVGNKVLCAYIVSNKKIAQSELKKYLNKYLLEYMIPSYFISIDTMPLTQNGKVNKSTLAKIDIVKYLDEELKLPANIEEEKLLAIWKKIFSFEQIGVESDFFELGGHSLKVANLVSEIYKTFDVEISISNVFDNPTIRQMSNFIKKMEKKKYLPIEKVGKQNYYETSFAQKRMFILDQMSPGSTNYNTSKAFKIYGPVDIDKIEQVVNIIVNRHEILRTNFRLINGEIVQEINEDVHVKVNYYEGDENQVESIIKSFIRPFDVERDSLIRVELVTLTSDKQILMIDTHHIVSDGVSFGIFLNEFFALYNEGEVSELPIQYKDYCHWENKNFIQEEIKNQEKYWSKIFEVLPERLNMPLDFERPYNKVYSGSAVRDIIPQQTVDKLKEFCNKCGITLNIALYSVYTLLLHKYTGQTDITCGVIMANRNHPDLENLIGVFINFLPIRNHIKPDIPFKEFLQMEKETILEAYSNSKYPFEKIADKISEEKVQNRNPIFDTMFVFHNQFEHKDNYSIEGLRIESIEIEKKTTKLDFQIDLAIDTNSNLVYTLEYDTQLFKENTMKAFSTHFKQLIETIIDNEMESLENINLSKQDTMRKQSEDSITSDNISDEKRKLILNFFNDDLRSE